MMRDRDSGGCGSSIRAFTEEYGDLSVTRLLIASDLTLISGTARAETVSGRRFETNRAARSRIELRSISLGVAPACRANREDPRNRPKRCRFRRSRWIRHQEQAGAP